MTNQSELKEMKDDSGIIDENQRGCSGGTGVDILPFLNCMETNNQQTNLHNYQIDNSLLKIASKGTNLPINSRQSFSPNSSSIQIQNQQSEIMEEYKLESASYQVTPTNIKTKQERLSSGQVGTTRVSARKITNDLSKQNSNQIRISKKLEN